MVIPEYFVTKEKSISQNNPFLPAAEPLHSVCGGGDILKQLLPEHFFFQHDGWALSQRNDILRLNRIQNKLYSSCLEKEKEESAARQIKHELLAQGLKRLCS